MRRIWPVLLLMLALWPASAQTDDIDRLLAGMTLQQKIGQMFMVNLFGLGLTDAGREMLETWQPGAVVLTDANIQSPEQITRLTNAYQETITAVRGVPLFVAVDQEGGIVARLKEGFTTWPVPMLLTAADDPMLAWQVGAALGGELRAVGVNMNLAPVADLQTNLRNPIIGRRSPGSDPAQVGRTIAGVIEGMQSVGVMATTKHFPGHGDTDEDSHITLPRLDLNLARLEALELPPFVSAIEAESGAIMTAHLWFPAFDPDAPTPASFSYNLVTGILREMLGYDGIIITDALDMDAIDTAYAPEEAAVLAVQAGNDIVLVGANAGEGIQARMMQAVLDAVQAGEIPEARIDESVRRILTAKARYGVLDWLPLDPATATERLPDQTALVTALFDAGITLVRGETPVTGEVAVIYPANRSLIQRECSSYRDDLRWYAVNDAPSPEQISTAQSLAAQAETLVVFTRDAYTNPAQQALVNALPPERTFVVALVSPYDLLRFPGVEGYLVTYSPLDPGVSAACDALFGTLTPGGSLSVTLPG